MLLATRSLKTDSVSTGSLPFFLSFLSCLVGGGGGDWSAGGVGVVAGVVGFCATSESGSTRAKMKRRKVRRRMVDLRNNNVMRIAGYQYSVVGSRFSVLYSESNFHDKLHFVSSTARCGCGGRSTRKCLCSRKMKSSWSRRVDGRWWRHHLR